MLKAGPFHVADLASKIGYCNHVDGFMLRTDNDVQYSSQIWYAKDFLKDREMQTHRGFRVEDRQTDRQTNQPTNKVAYRGS